MNTISLSTPLYNDALHYASEKKMSVDEWVASVIIRNLPKAEKKYKMKTIDELSPELQEMIGFAKPAEDLDDDINGDRARMEYLTEKYSL